MSQQFCLKWNNHMNNMMEVFKSLLSSESMVDVTLACDGLSLKAHKMVLSACSPFFQSLFLENPCKHPIVILKDMKYTELKAIVEFMYHGEVNVAQDQLSALMKTAETLRVKGLAEVTNEKSQSNQNEEPSHRSVPRSESPQSSKRRRGRVRKRSFSDSNHSDASNEPKMKLPSPEIEELSCDATMDTSSGQYSNMPSQVPMQSHSTNSFHKSVVSQDPHIEEPASADENEFGVEPAKLLEQTLTTDDITNQRRNRMSNIEMQRRPRGSTDHSSNLVPSSMPSEPMGSSQLQPESPPDIKPELLDLDPVMSPVAGPSHSADNSMMMYMDQSSLSSHPGTSSSGYQDNTALVPTDSQPQDFYTCDKCNRVFTSFQAMASHKAKHRPNEDEKRHRCSLCAYATNYSSHLKQHMYTHSGERPHRCTRCDAGFTQRWHLKRHEANHDLKDGDAGYKKSPPTPNAKPSPKRNDSVQPGKKYLSNNKEHHMNDCGKSSMHKHNKVLYLNHKPKAADYRNGKNDHASGVNKVPPKTKKLNVSNATWDASKNFYECDADKEANNGVLAKFAESPRKPTEVTQSVSSVRCKSTQKHHKSRDNKAFVDVFKERQTVAEKPSTKIPHHQKPAAEFDEILPPTQDDQEMLLSSNHSPKSGAQVSMKGIQDELTATESEFRGGKTDFDFFPGDSLSDSPLSPNRLEINEESREDFHFANSNGEIHRNYTEQMPCDLEQSIFDCDRCGRTFEKAKLFLKHKKEHRRQDKPYKCQKCGKRFSKLTYLKKHEKKHRKDDTFEKILSDQMTEPESTLHALGESKDVSNLHAKDDGNEEQDIIPHETH